jgi:hypothetical protein
LKMHRVLGTRPGLEIIGAAGRRVGSQTGKGEQA